MGRKATPTVLRVIAGNPAKRPINTKEPIPPGDLRDPPDWFNDDQRAAWQYAIENSAPGLLKRVDQSLLVVWVVAHVMHRDAALKVAKQGQVVRSPVKGEPMQNPYLAVVNRQAQIMLKASAELGFTPASRAKLVTGDGGGGGDEDGPFGQFR